MFYKKIAFLSSFDFNKALDFAYSWIFVHTSGVSGGLASLSLEHLASMLATNESVTIKYRSQCCDWSIALMCARMKTKCSWLLHHRLEGCEVRQTKDFPTPWFRNFCLQKANNTSDCLSPIKDQRSLAQYTTMNWNIIRVDYIWLKFVFLTKYILVMCFVMASFVPWSLSS